MSAWRAVRDLLRGYVPEEDPTTLSDAEKAAIEAERARWERRERDVRLRVLRLRADMKTRRGD